MTAFSTPWGLYEWIRVPFGISNAPPVFQRHINLMLAGLRDSVCIGYLDDILVYGKSFEEQVQNLVRVLKRLQSKGVKLRADKCVFLKEEVRYLGRLISANGYRPDPKDTEALERFRQPPKNVGELRTLLGFFGYYRSYIRNFAQKFKPLYNFLKVKNVAPDATPKRRSPSSAKHKQLSSGTSIVWNEECQAVVEETIDYLKSPHFLVYPNYELPFILHCDASEKGLGAVLYQKQDGKDRVVSFASRTLTDPECNYHLHSGKLEFLALKWAVTQRFEDYLCYGPPFTVFTDNNPLTYVMSTAKLNATGLRWVGELANFQFSLKYKPGKKHTDADALSRVSSATLAEMERDCTELLDPESVSSIMAISGKPQSDCPLFVDVNVLEFKAECQSVETFSKEDVRLAQLDDSVIGPVYEVVAAGNRRHVDTKTWSRKSKVLLKQFPLMSIENGLLVRRTPRGKLKQLVLPEKFHHLVFVELHEKMGHLGPDRVEGLCRRRYYWPYMRKDIDHYVQRKCRCIVSKRPNVLEAAPLVPIESTYPFELVCVDFIDFKTKSQGYRYALLVTDHFTKFSQAYATKSKSSKAAATELFNKFIPQFGLPHRIHSDQGPEFTSGLFKELHRLGGIEMSNTTPYHPMGNGLVERLNRSLKQMLQSLPEPHKKKWKEHLPSLMFAYNSTTHSTTGYSPFFLMFGRESKLPIDCILPYEPADISNKTYKKFVDSWKASMKTAFQIAHSRMVKSGEYNKKLYDSKVKLVAVGVGDRVLLKNLDRNENRKLKTYWERRIYEVVSKLPDLPVYTIKPVSGKGREKTVHRNLLMRVNDLPLNVFDPPVAVPRQTRDNVASRQPSPQLPPPPVVVPAVVPALVDTSGSDSESTSEYSDDGCVVIQDPGPRSFVAEEGGSAENVVDAADVVDVQSNAPGSVGAAGGVSDVDDDVEGQRSSSSGTVSVDEDARLGEGRIVLAGDEGAVMGDGRVASASGEDAESGNERDTSASDSGSDSVSDGDDDEPGESERELDARASPASDSGSDHASSPDEPSSESEREPESSSEDVMTHSDDSGRSVDSDHSVDSDATVEYDLDEGVAAEAGLGDETEFETADEAVFQTADESPDSEYASPVAEDGAGSSDTVSTPTPTPTGDADAAGADDHVSEDSDSGSGSDTQTIRRPAIERTRRVRLPPKRLTYDEPGKPRVVRYSPHTLSVDVVPSPTHHIPHEGTPYEPGVT